MKTRLTSQPAHSNPSVKSTTHRTTSVVMDVLPWPNGCGFSGGDSWWRHVLSQSERERLDNLIGLALLDKGVCEQLVTKCDPALLSTFGLSERTQDWLKSIGATTLRELAEAIVAATQSSPFDVAAAEAA
ncbi:MAG: hypothetical protein ACYDEO_17700 [Aggregatilineales bacterium]